jgi:Ca-activated chloride channel family protein
MAEDGEALRAVYSEIDSLEKSEIESIRYMDYTERFTPFALAGLVMLALEILLRTTYFRRIP